MNASFSAFARTRNMPAKIAASLFLALFSSVAVKSEGEETNG